MGGGTTFTTANADCCTPKATCDCYTSCPAGQKLKAGASSIRGTGDISTLTATLCCDADTARCGGLGADPCSSSMFRDSSKAGVFFATAATDCCTARAACSATPSSACSAGYMKKMWYCTTSATDST